MWEMKAEELYEFININDFSSTPKYLQLTNSIIAAIESGRMERNCLLPSINEISFKFDIGRDTVERGYRHLRKLGIIYSVPGKGYYTSNIDFRQKIKVFLLFNKLSAHKKIIYESLVETLGADTGIDLYVYNNDAYLFKKILANIKDDYTHYVIIPHCADGEEHVVELINQIPKEKLLLLDKLLSGVNGDYKAVYENFGKDIYGALKNALPELAKYDTLKLVFPSLSCFPKEIVVGFRQFCQQYAFTHDVIDDVTKCVLSKGEVYISLTEDDLVLLLQKVTTSELNIGIDIGVISYNETPIKKILLNGITTISTDFQKMGQVAANMIIQNRHEQVEIPFYYIKRASL